MLQPASHRFNPPVRRTLAFARSWLPVLAWMAIIFIASADTESGYRGSRILGPIIRWFVPDISPEGLKQAVLYARKGVHFVTFAILALLLLHALVARLPQPWPRSRFAFAWILTVAYAVSDEIHQTFVPTRVGSAWDVAIDSLGAATALWVVHRWLHRRRRA